MNKVIHIIFAVLLVAGACLAQMDVDEAEFAHDYGPAKLERKRPSLFRRPEQGSPESQLLHARELEQAGRLGKAMRQYRALVHQWHGSTQAGPAQEAYARLLEQTRRYEKAFNEYQYLIKNFSGRFDYGDVIARQFAIAHHVMTEAESRWTRSTRRALPLFGQIVQNAPNWERSAESQFYVGWIHESHKDYEDAVLAYETVQYRYPRSEYAPAASFRRSFCLYTLARRHHRDEATLRDALSALTEFLRDHETDENASIARRYQDELRESLAQMYYDRAAFYDRMARKPGPALIAYRDFLRQFPSSELALQVNTRVEELQQQLESTSEP